MAVCWGNGLLARPGLGVAAILVASGAWASPGGTWESSFEEAPRARVIEESLSRSETNETEVKWDLESPALTFKMSSGGTSCYVVVQADGRDVGAFVPHNSATNPNAESGYYGIAKLMGLESLFQVGLPFKLGPRAVQKMRNVVSGVSIKNSAKRENCNNVMSKTSKDPSTLIGVFKVWDDRPYGYDDMVSPRSGKNGEPKLSHPIMRALQAAYSWPSDSEKLSFNGYSASVAALASDYGVIMLFDALFNQWDRYSGGNVTVALSKDSKSFRMYSVDNGGASPTSSNWTSKHVGWMTRYPKEVTEQFADLENFLDGKRASFAGFSDPLELVRSVGMVYDHSAETYRKQLSKNLGIIRRAVEASVAKNGEGKSFYHR